MVFSASGREHFEIALGEAFRRLFVDGVKRVHQAVAEGIGVNVERGMHKVRNIGPKRFVAAPKLDCLSETLPLYLEPKRVETLDGELAGAAFRVDVALERVERYLPHHGVDHVLDLGGEHGLALLGVGLCEELLEREHFAEDARGLGKRERSGGH